MTGSKKAKRKRWDWIPEVLVSITVYQKDILRLLLVDIRSYLLCSNPCSWIGMVSSSLAATLRLNSKMARRLRRHLPGKKTKADIKNDQFTSQLSWLNSLALNLHPCTCNSNAWWCALIFVSLLVLSDWKWCFGNSLLFTVPQQPWTSFKTCWGLAGQILMLAFQLSLRAKCPAWYILFKNPSFWVLVTFFQVSIFKTISLPSTTWTQSVLYILLMLLGKAFT